MRRLYTRNRALVVALAVALSVVVGSAANAYWKGAGSGTGTGTTGTTVAVTLTPGTATAGLYPGGNTDVMLGVGNSNLSPVRLGSLALATGQGTGGFAVDAGHSGCTLATLSLATQTNGGSGWTVPARAGAVNGTLSITLPNALAMGVGAVNACQGAMFTVYLTAGP